jgi:hypothetical protein
MTILRTWMLLTGALVGGFLVWNYVPVLLPLAAIAVVFAGLTGLIRAVVERFDRRPPPHEDAD